MQAPIVHYIDDILIYSINENEHVKYIQILLSELKNAGFKINSNKCQFSQDEVNFIEYKLDEKFIKMDDETVKNIKEYKKPHNLKSLTEFLWVVNYFKKL